MRPNRMTSIFDAATPSRDNQQVISTPPAKANQAGQYCLVDDNAFEVPHFDPSEEYIMDDSISDGDDDNCEPFIGLEFTSIEEAREFYNTYACKNGFSIRKFTHYMSKVTGKETFVKYVCSKQGKPLGKRKTPELGELSGPKTPEKNRSSTRCDCKAAMNINYSQKDENWHVSQFYKDHNHELIVSPSKKRILKSQKYMSEEQKELIKLLGGHGVKPSQILEILAVQVGGRHNLCFSRKDVSNVIARENRKLIGVDMDSTIVYFNQLKQSDPDFFYSVETDADQTVKCLFWVNGRSRRSYREFGDVVIFDTTYSTNKYSMPCGPFVGVNHHRQSIFFGCALIRDEKMSTFEWLFETWLKAMGDKHPRAIITDQDPAMKGAIAKIFPNTVHRCCKWHVMRKAREHLGVLYGQNPKFKKDLFACINQSLIVEEFEKKWTEMIVTHNLQENRHLNTMFSNAGQWVPAYFRGVFFAEMSTSQRSENMNAVMKLWLGSHTYICNFVIQFEKITASIFDKESEEDIRTIDHIHNLWSEDELEEQARDVYTRNVFLVFRDILRRASGFSIEVLENDKLYLIKSQKYRATYKVHVNRATFEVSCECNGFEFEGILCSHALKVMQSIGMNTLPSHYILKRWTKDCNKDAKRSMCDKRKEMGEFDMSGRRLAMLTEKFNKICINASKTQSSFAIAWAKLDELANENGDGEEGTPANPVTTHASSQTQSLCDPPVSQCKGKRKPHRIKPPAETAGKKMRQCSICKKKAGHNAATCPQKNKLDGNDESGDYGSDGEGYDDYDIDERALN